MDDRELLGLLAAEAPAPRPGLADEVLARARRTRARRRWKAAAGGLALAAAVTVAVPVVLHQVEDAQRGGLSAAPEAGRAPEDAKRAPDLDSAESLARSSGESADVYAAVLEALRPAERNIGALRILDRLCPLRGECADHRLDGVLKDELSARVPSVRFVDPESEEAALQSEPLRLGEVSVGDGGRASVPVSGRLVRLELRQGRWQVVDGL